jgi:hypothetical protein
MKTKVDSFADVFSDQPLFAELEELTVRAFAVFRKSPFM